MGLHAWFGFGVAAWPGTVFIWQRSAVWTLAPHFRVSAVSVGILVIGVSRSRLAFSDMLARSVGCPRYCGQAVLWRLADLYKKPDQTLSTARDKNPG